MPESNTTKHQMYDVTDQHFQGLIIMEVFTFLLLIASVFFLYLIKKKMSDLNPLIKSILYFLAGFKITLNLIDLITVLVILLWQSRNFSLCMIHILVSYFKKFGTIVSLSIISNVRLYLAIQTSPLTPYKKKQIQYIMVIIYIVSFGMYTLNFIHSGWNGSIYIVNKCSNIYSNNNLTFTYFVNFALPIYFILINFVGDATLLNFIWSRRRNTVIVHHISSNNMKNDMSTPIRSILMSLFCLISVILHLHLRVEIDNFNFWFGRRVIIVMIIDSIYFNIIIPYTILYEISRTKESYPVVYQGFHIYEDEKENVDGEFERFSNVVMPKKEVIFVNYDIYSCLIKVG